ncbi:MAG: hypothetical protein U0790_24990 [Isosphaeraceae bacterium]
MIRKLVDAILVCVTLIGAWFAWETGQERSRLERTYARMVAAVGDLPIGDPGKIHLRALETGEPLHFAWRVYFPANSNVRVSSPNGGFFTSSSSGATEFLARVRLRENAQGQIDLYTHFSGGSSRSTLFDPKLTKLLHGRWGEIRVEQLGSPDLAVLDPDKPAILLRLILPEDLQAEARKVLDEYDLKRIIPEFYELTIGPPDASP